MRKLPFSALLLSSVLALTSLSVQASPDTDRVSQKIREKTGMIPTSVQKSPVAAFEAHMLEGKDPAEIAEGKCDYSALHRNLEIGRELGITGTPTIIFPDGSRVSGALTPDQIEARLAAAK